MSRARCRFALILISVLVVFGAGCGDGPDDRSIGTTTSSVATSATTSILDNPTTSVPASTTPIPTLEVSFAGGAVTGGPRRESLPLGETVRIRATSDVAEELHVHTYDGRVDLAPGVPGEIVLVLDIPGRHEVEFEHSGKVALTLEVR